MNRNWWEDNGFRTIYLNELSTLSAEELLAYTHIVFDQAIVGTYVVDDQAIERINGLKDLYSPIRATHSRSVINALSSAFNLAVWKVGLG